MASLSLTPLWEVLGNLVPPQPQSPALPWQWHYDDIRAFLMRAGSLISAEQAERRVLILENPGLPGQSAITPSLYAGLQLVLPGEVAPAHRHAQCALRFVLEGSGGYTRVDGEPAVMHPFDLVLTPGGQWHDHGNASDGPMVWLDGLDIPIVRLFDASYAEKYREPVYPDSVAGGDTLARYGQNLRPIRGSSADRRPLAQPLFHYPYAVWRQSLRQLAAAERPDPHLGHALEFTNPADGGSIMPTISADVRLIPGGFATRPRRTTAGTVVTVVEGAGEALIGDIRFDLGTRDVFVIPSWCATHFKARTDLVLFCMSDQSAQQKLSLFREVNA